MRREDILEDESLEALNLITEIDTLLIVNQAHIQKEKRKLQLKEVRVLFLAIMILTMNFVLAYKAGIRIFLLVQLSLSWLITALFMPMLKKVLREG